MKKQYAVLGLGNFGTSVAVTLQNLGCEVVVADGSMERIQNIADSVSYAVKGDITDKELVSTLSALEICKQYVAVSQKACDNVRIEKEIELSYLERQIITDAADLNREKGIRLANDICKNHRREGLYFDEIMEGIVNGQA